jgi:hypothetical protein
MSWKILRVVNKNKRNWCEVRCNCGYVGLRRKDHIDSGRTTACKKCSSSNTLKEHPNSKFGPRPHQGVGDISKTLWSAYKEGAKKRAVPFSITIEYAWDLFEKQNRLCALSGIPITLKHGYKGCNVDWKGFTASLDRIDSEKGYVEGNVQWVHEDINYIKRDLPEGRFIELCKAVSKTK